MKTTLRSSIRAFEIVLLSVLVLSPDRTNAITIHDIAALNGYTFDVFGVPPGPLSLVDNGSEEWSVVFSNLGLRTPTQLVTIVYVYPLEGRSTYPRPFGAAFMQQFQTSLEISSYQIDEYLDSRFDVPGNAFIFDINIPDISSSAALLILSLSILLFPRVAEGGLKMIRTFSFVPSY